MNWNTHFDLANKHSFLSPSKYHWIRYDGEKLIDVLENRERAARGTKIHAVAESLIELAIRLPETNASLNAFVNDAIRLQMSPEQILAYSKHAFGTADAVSFHDNVLRIHDLKTGVHAGHPEQLEIYAAFFCLEYSVRPNDIEILLRIYQHDIPFVEWSPEPENIMRLMAIIMSHNKMIDEYKGAL